MSVFDADMIAKIEHHLNRFETKRSAILPILNDFHTKYGYVSDAQVEELEKEFNLSKVHVQEVITFYSRYRQEKPARYMIQFCDNIVCRMFDSAQIIAHLRARAAASTEGLFEIEAVPCLGVCDGAPAMLVNDERYLRVGRARADEIIDKYMREDA